MLIESESEGLRFRLPPPVEPQKSDEEISDHEKPPN
jgi:hypothetical protein